MISVFFGCYFWLSDVSKVLTLGQYVAIGVGTGQLLSQGEKIKGKTSEGPATTLVMNKGFMKMG
ncbi:MAG: hypothetical protein WCD24_05395 [Serratia inhibens]|uniref:hypothetical protein n=1 Tax=Serratia inhibens TaxID=2338073 RepID=UPI003C7B9D53